MSQKTVETETCLEGPKLDPRVRRTRRLLEDAMRSLMAERSFSSISVGDITERATVNRATFYAHYLDKHDLARSVLRDSFHKALIERLRPPRNLDVESLTDVGLATFEFLAMLQNGCAKEAESHEEGPGAALQEILQDFLHTWLTLQPTSMRHFPGTTPHTASSVMAWSLFGGAVGWSRQRPRPKAGPVVREIVGLLLRTPSTP